MLDASDFDRAAWLLGAEWEAATHGPCGLREDQWGDYTEERDYCAACEANTRMWESMGDKIPPGATVRFVWAQDDDAPVSRFVDPDWADRR